MWLFKGGCEGEWLWIMGVGNRYVNIVNDLIAPVHVRRSYIY